MDAKRITLKDIGRESGLSVSAVSLALRNSPSIPEDTRRRVREVAEKIGYKPDPALAALGAHRQSIKRGRVTTTIAYLDTRDPSKLQKSIVEGSEYLAGARRRAGDLGYNIELFWMQREAGDGPKASRILQARGIRAVIIAPFESPEGELDLDWPQFCVVSLGRSMARPLVHAVSHDHAGSIGTAIIKLLELGYKRPGLVLEPHLNARVSRRWLASFLVEQQTRINARDRVPPLIDPMKNPEPFFKWLQRSRPDVVISIAGRALNLIKSHGLKIPQDIGYVDLDAHGSEISGIVQNMGEVGALAVDTIHRSLLSNDFGLPRARQLTLLEGHWQTGQTLRNRAPVPK